jgi:hypothetical protein
VCVNENYCGGGGCVELSICDYVSECLDGRGGGKCIPIKRFKNLLINNEVSCSSHPPHLVLADRKKV